VPQAREASLLSSHYVTVLEVRLIEH
jgi:hypothetical protein